MSNDIPRRIRLDKFVPAETAIREAQRAVEAMPPDVRLTRAGIKLQEGRDLVADFVDGVAGVPETTSQPPTPSAATFERQIAEMKRALEGLELRLDREGFRDSAKRVYDARLRMSEADRALPRRTQPEEPAKVPFLDALRDGGLGEKARDVLEAVRDNTCIVSMSGTLVSLGEMDLIALCAPSEEHKCGWRVTAAGLHVLAVAPRTPSAEPDPGHPHLIGGEFQSDKYPTCPRGKVPLSVKDPTAQDLLWTYAQRRRAVDAEFSTDLETALRAKGFSPRAVEALPGDLVTVEGMHANVYSVVDVDGPDAILRQIATSRSEHFARAKCMVVQRRNDARLQLSESAVRGLYSVTGIEPGDELALMAKLARRLGVVAPGRSGVPIGIEMAWETVRRILGMQPDEGIADTLDELRRLVFPRLRRDRAAPVAMFAVGAIVRVKATGQGGRVSEVRDVSEPRLYAAGDGAFVFSVTSLVDGLPIRTFVGAELELAPDLVEPATPNAVPAHDPLAPNLYEQCRTWIVDDDAILPRRAMFSRVASLVTLVERLRVSGAW